MSYRTAEAAVRDGWWVSYGKGPWWDTSLHYGVTAKRDDYHVELGANSIADLRHEVCRLDSLPTRLRFTRGWWSDRRRERAAASRETRLASESDQPKET